MIYRYGCYSFHNIKSLRDPTKLQIIRDAVGWENIHHITRNKSVPLYGSNVIKIYNPSCTIESHVLNVNNHSSFTSNRIVLEQWILCQLIHPLPLLSETICFENQKIKVVWPLADIEVGNNRVLHYFRWVKKTLQLIVDSYGSFILHAATLFTCWSNYGLSFLNS